MEKTLLWGGFDAIKWHIGNLELNHEKGSRLPKLRIPRSYPARQIFFLQKTHPVATDVKMLRGIFKMSTGKHFF